MPSFVGHDSFERSQLADAESVDDSHYGVGLPSDLPHPYWTVLQHG
jgi:hypothetical protein